MCLKPVLPTLGSVHFPPHWGTHGPPSSSSSSTSSPSRLTYTALTVCPSLFKSFTYIHSFNPHNNHREELGLPFAFLEPTQPREAHFSRNPGILSSELGKNGMWLSECPSLGHRSDLQLKPEMDTKGIQCSWKFALERSFLFGPAPNYQRHGTCSLSSKLYQGAWGARGNWGVTATCQLLLESGPLRLRSAQRDGCPAHTCQAPAPRWTLLDPTSLGWLADTETNWTPAFRAWKYTWGMHAKPSCTRTRTGGKRTLTIPQERLRGMGGAGLVGIQLKGESICTGVERAGAGRGLFGALCKAQKARRTQACLGNPKWLGILCTQRMPWGQDEF